MCRVSEVNSRHTHRELQSSQQMGNLGYNRGSQYVQMGPGIGSN